jgi:hypothetical protein
MTTTDSTTTPARAPGTVPALVRCDSCVHCGYRNAHLIRCKYPRERAPEVVDLTDALGYTRNWAAEMCDKYSPNARVRREMPAAATETTDAK